jgi:2-amino-4-hydroxy-6-hydroxymethyldihydropteridine diphosphokinase
MNEAYLCLGGNLGNCVETFKKALKLLEKGGAFVTETSVVYSGPAWGMENAPDFYNQAVRIKTALDPQELMNLVLSTEQSLGRTRNNAGAYESRSIDIDILFFNDLVLQEKNLEIPHPRLHLRRFVLEPLSEIAPNLIHPVLKKNITDLLELCPDKNSLQTV